ncbi:MAG: glycoside hydrolase family 97 protein [Bacteroidales bacterium]|nr:glycoside hydrolase family 97 protein [Bacteroidales bacterium]
MLKLMTILAAVLMTVGAAAASKHYELKSPDGNLVVSIEAGEGVSYSLTHGQDLLIAMTNIAMATVEGVYFGGVQPVKKVTRRSVSETIQTVVYKKVEVKDEFNEIVLRFKNFSVVFRAYDDGMAYRFISHLKGQYHIEYEMAKFDFVQDWNMWVAYVAQHTETLESQFYNSFENRYSYTPLSQWDKSRMAFLPLLVDGPDGKKIAITEADLLNYPGMCLYNDMMDGDSDSELETRFADYPDEVTQGGHNNLQMEVQSRHPYIARCNGEQAFPWRIISVSTEDIQMADNDMVYRLATPSDPTKDWSWVKPGKVAWDWWNDWNIDGVDFKSGINNETYKYYIDFASANGIEYVILDEGWSVNGAADLFQVVPSIDLELLVKYASERNVGLILWAGYWAFDRDMENVCKHYSEMGIKGFKIDFMDRDDQYMVDFHRRAAEMTAKYHLLADFHGSYKPTGLHRTYPNVINFEGVHGLETMKWSGASVDQVTYDVTFPYIRMMTGPVDYTQGAMLNATRGNYHAVYNEPMSQGTRCRQLAQYVIFDSPLNMLCDSPSNYKREQECLNFIAAVPTVWDETKGLCGKVGEYIAIARRSGDDWYVGAMTDWTSRELVLDLTFLPEGSYEVELYRDGVNAYRIARDYKKEVIELPSDRNLTVNMAPGGGFAAKIVKK